MFSRLAQKLEALFTSTDDQARDAYLAGSVDFADLERRLHCFEANHAPYGWLTSNAPRDWNA